MTLDVLIPTYNRAPQLARTLESLLAADRPGSMPFVVTVCSRVPSQVTCSLCRALNWP